MAYAAYYENGQRMLRCLRCGMVVSQTFGFESNWTSWHNRNLRLPFGYRIPLKCKDESDDFQRRVQAIQRRS